MRVAVAGIHIESGTFNPVSSSEADFQAWRGPALRARYPFLEKPPFRSWDWAFLVHFRALPGGVVTANAFRAMKAEILDGLVRAMPVDAFFFDVHGAMSVAGLEDAEADLLAAIRDILGPDRPVTCAQDLHGNLSAELVGLTDFITAYRTAPHIDTDETRERACRFLAHPGPRPWRAWLRVPVLLSGERTSTDREPMATLYRTLAAQAVSPPLRDLSLWIGYAWADQPRAGAAVVALADDAETARTAAADMGTRYWRAREACSFVAAAGNAARCLAQGWERGHPGIFLSDSGDNPTAGGAGDVPETIRDLLAFPPVRTGAATAIYASIPDADAIDAAFAAGTGGRFDRTVGGRLDPIRGTPLPLAATVRSLHPGDTIGGRQAVLAAGGLRLILTERRKPFHHRDDFLALGLEPRTTTFTVVKIGYLEPELAAMARAHFIILSPGAVAQDLCALDYQRLRRPLYPLDPSFGWSPHPILFPPRAIRSVQNRT